MSSSSPVLQVSSTTKTTSSVPEKKWYEHITLDLFLAVLHRTFLHPWVAWIVVLSLRAQVTPYTDPAFIVATGYATLLTLYYAAQIVNQRIAYGLPRQVDLGEEVVMITGGASGLGLLIAQIYGMRGVSVAVLDIKEVEEIEGWDELSGVEYYRCDVGNRKEVEMTARRIEKDVCNFSSFLIFCLLSLVSDDISCADLHFPSLVHPRCL